MNANLEYLADITILNSLAKDSPLVAFAQDAGIMGSVESGVKSYIAEHFDRNKPIASLTALFGSGLLYSLGFKWMSVLYMLAEALGFNWVSLWSAVGNGISEFAKDIIGSKHKATQAEASSKVNAIVSSAVQDSFSGEPDTQKLTELANQKLFSRNMQEAHELKALATQLELNPKLTKEAGAASTKWKLGRFFIRTISFLAKTALISCGFVVAAGAISGLVGNKSPNSDANKQDRSAKIFKLQVSPSVSPNIFNIHQNDMQSVWIESGEISNIDAILKSWILNTYPQLASRYSDIQSSSAYSTVVAAFNKRNRLAAGLGMFSVPRPYQRKADVVSAIVNGYLESEPWEKEQQSAQQPNTDSQDFAINNKE